MKHLTLLILLVCFSSATFTVRLPLKGPAGQNIDFEWLRPREGRYTVTQTDGSISHENISGGVSEAGHILGFPEGVHNYVLRRGGSLPPHLPTVAPPIFQGSGITQATLFAPTMENLLSLPKSSPQKSTREQSAPRMQIEGDKRGEKRRERTNSSREERSLDCKPDSFDNSLSCSSSSGQLGKIRKVEDHLAQSEAVSPVQVSASASSSSALQESLLELLPNFLKDLVVSFLDFQSLLRVIRVKTLSDFAQKVSFKLGDELAELSFNIKSLTQEVIRKLFVKFPKFLYFDVMGRRYFRQELEEFLNQISEIKDGKLIYKSENLMNTYFKQQQHNYQMRLRYVEWLKAKGQIMPNESTEKTSLEEILLPTNRASEWQRNQAHLLIALRLYKRHNNPNRNISSPIANEIIGHLRAILNSLHPLLIDEWQLNEARLKLAEMLSNPYEGATIPYDEIAQLLLDFLDSPLHSNKPQEANQARLWLARTRLRGFIIDRLTVGQAINCVLDPNKPQETNQAHLLESLLADPNLTISKAINHILGAFESSKNDLAQARPIKKIIKEMLGWGFAYWTNEQLYKLLFMMIAIEREKKQGHTCPEPWHPHRAPKLTNEQLCQLISRGFFKTALFFPPDFPPPFDFNREIFKIAPGYTVNLRQQMQWHILCAQINLAQMPYQNSGTSIVVDSVTDFHLHRALTYPTTNPEKIQCKALKALMYLQGYGPPRMEESVDYLLGNLLVSPQNDSRWIIDQAHILLAYRHLQGDLPGKLTDAKVAEYLLIVAADEQASDWQRYEAYITLAHMYFEGRILERLTDIKVAEYLLIVAADEQANNWQRYEAYLMLARMHLEGRIFKRLTDINVAEYLLIVAAGEQANNWQRYEAYLMLARMHLEGRILERLTDVKVAEYLLIVAADEQANSWQRYEAYIMLARMHLEGRILGRLTDGDIANYLVAILDNEQADENQRERAQTLLKPLINRLENDQKP